ncbi:hypothetical protein [Salsuginibacillus kocurii]|uniref:hypothetical protein n=1 Tax=Salsuginibacillus kocurii TaxID=427078 RepID=UPI000381E199|nr:hypothetical protein [Salsuginibacillus kocurii]
MEVGSKAYYYQPSTFHRMEVMTLDRIRSLGFDLKVSRADLPFFIGFFRKLTAYYQEKKKQVPPNYKTYMEEAAYFFEWQCEQMVHTSSIQSSSPFYVIPFTDLVAALMLSDQVFDRVFEDWNELSNGFDQILTYYRRFMLKVDPSKAQFILDHLEELNL